MGVVSREMRRDMSHEIVVNYSRFGQLNVIKSLYVIETQPSQNVLE